MFTKLFVRLAFLFIFAALAISAQIKSDASTNHPPVTVFHPTEEPFQIQTDQDLALAQRAEQIRADCIRGRRSICGKILAVLPDGLVVESGYTNLLRQPLTRSWLVPGTVTASRAVNLMEGAVPGSVCFDTVYLTDYPKSKRLKPKRYDYVIIQGYPTGQYTYNSLGTIHKTVRRFSAQLSKAVELNLQAEQKPPQPAAGAK
jgi:hypothetical protein